jgi:hypothetical protein
MAELRRVDIGFEGGQILALRMLDEEYQKLRGALADERSDHWHQVLTQDSEVAVDLSEVVYIRLDTEEHKVGF